MSVAPWSAGTGRPGRGSGSVTVPRVEDSDPGDEGGDDVVEVGDDLVIGVRDGGAVAVEVHLDDQLWPAHPDRVLRPAGHAEAPLRAG